MQSTHDSFSHILRTELPQNDYARSQDLLTITTIFISNNKLDWLLNGSIASSNQSEDFVARKVGFN